MHQCVISVANSEIFGADRDQIEIKPARGFERIWERSVRSFDEAMLDFLYGRTLKDDLPMSAICLPEQTLNTGPRLVIVMVRMI